MRRRSSRFLTSVLLLGASLAIPCAASWSAGAQTAPESSAEMQRQLNLDRDPVSAPDGDVPATTKPAASTTHGPGNNNTTLTRQSGGQYTLQKNVDEVLLNATVLDDSHRLVASLDKNDFKIFEDGTEQTIASFQHQDIPISLGILVDNSGSMRPKRDAVNHSALDLVHASNPEDESFVVNFSDESYLDQEFTSSPDKLRDGLSHIASKGGTALYDAVNASADYMSKNARRSKQVLLVITDGEDNASMVSLESTVRRIQALEGPVVYCIGLLYDDDGGGRETRAARRALQRLADETGGLAFFPKSLDEVDAIAGEVARDIREQYTIGYHSTKPANLGGFRAIRVEAKAKGYGKLIVRTRTGYYPMGSTPATGAGNPGASSTGTGSPDASGPVSSNSGPTDSGSTDSGSTDSGVAQK